MKKAFLLLPVLMLIIMVSRAQTHVYHPFPESNAFWSDDGSNMFTLACYDTRFGLNGDTTINGKLYHKVYSLRDSTLLNPLSSYFAAIREEDKRIFTVVGNSGEQVLYDFNLTVGDTMRFHYSLMFHSPQEFYRVVTNIDSTKLFNGEYRKRFVFNDGNSLPDVVVEGIGSIYWMGLFNPLINAAATNGDSFRFECFKQNETILFLNNPECDHCFCTFFTDKKEMASPVKLSITPNPFFQQTTIRTDQYLSNATLSVYDALGQMMTQKTNLGGNIIVLERNNLLAGLYCLRITQDNKLICTGKFEIVNN